MQETTSREKILKKVRNALMNKPDLSAENVDWNRPVYAEMPDPVDIAFAKELNRVGGKFLYCEGHADFAGALEALMEEREWKNIFCLEPAIQDFLLHHDISYRNKEDDFAEMTVGLTGCEFLVARLGSVMVSSAHKSGRRINVFPETHLVMAYASQIVPDLKQALKGIRQRYAGNFPSMVSLITGPSRTADIEKTLVMGAHGPKELIVFLIEDR
ncbi:MAG: lactate utilization protein [Bacteroidales bacterium]|nr:lactate utilization protein [Bacteroidales bacterium]MCF8377506.1 lactate utilization protein [Bacteroidales bacterium]MCF8401629.1 lactate utilization protein [Bacteroidales bacterium]